MITLRLSSLIVLAVLLCPRAAWAEGEVAPLASHTLTAVRRTLLGLPSKGIIADAAGWKRVTRGRVDVPAAPDFERGQVAAVVVVDTRGKAQVTVNGLRCTTPGELLVDLTRHEQKEHTLNPHATAFVWVLPATFRGVRLVYRTLLEGGGGTLQRTFPAVPADSERRGLPRLGPDLRISYVMADGSPPPEVVLLRHDAIYPRSGDRPGQVDEVPFPSAGLPFPRIRDGVVHLYAAFAPGFRSRNPLRIKQLPRNGADGSPVPIRHEFVLEPIEKQ